MPSRTAKAPAGEARLLVTQVRSAIGSKPCRRAENSKASAMPAEIASPCSSRSEKPQAASSA